MSPYVGITRKQDGGSNGCISNYIPLQDGCYDYDKFAQEDCTTWDTRLGEGVCLQHGSSQVEQTHIFRGHVRTTGMTSSGFQHSSQLLTSLYHHEPSDIDVLQLLLLLHYTLWF